MFSILTLSPEQINIKLGRITNIMSSGFKFTQFEYGNINEDKSKSIEWCKQYGETKNKETNELNNNSSNENFAVWTTNVLSEDTTQKKRNVICDYDKTNINNYYVDDIIMQTINW